MKAIITSVIFTVLVLQISLLVKAEQLSNEETDKNNLEEKNEQYESIKRRLHKILTTANDDESSNSDEEESNESSNDSSLDKRMTYRYGKRMTYRYGKRSAMPYRFGKRSQQPSLNPQDLLELLKMVENDERINKRMTYRYGRGLNKRSTR